VRAGRDRRGGVPAAARAAALLDRGAGRPSLTPRLPPSLVYFNNDGYGHAVRNAERLRELTGT
jgi:hypothetical protein